tara:strand:+ start:3740 stop:4495 length:756 start_codon:yes stop_codon:yes gene_type:complete
MSRRALKNLPARRGKSSKVTTKSGKTGYLTDTSATNGPDSFDDPGMPKIGATAKFRANVKKELDNKQSDFNDRMLSIEITGKPIQRNSRNAIRTKKINEEDRNVSFTGYFDKTEVKSVAEQIQNSIMGHAKTTIRQGIQKALVDTKSEISGMTRNFKSSYRRNQPHEDDIYNRIAESLNIVDSGKESETFRFLSIGAGSFDGKDSDTPTGIKGSRGANLAEMTETGTSPFKNRGRVLVGGTARIQDALKTR